ncbi:hypothetical protein ANCCAN_07290 [Ancylostoma caninum]|uniref:G protein-coupled receptor n=1 Tax=Ancylostoma caninum TaxID=29170 RepID=A0A368GQL0_ANCCA|nr:hypothetical protein ANCCAN_07290 [Ancylostoma caninum]
MDDKLSTTIYAVYSLGFVNSCTLLLIYFCCPLKHVSSYRYFFMLAAIHDMTFSTTAIMISPVAVNAVSLGFILQTTSIGVILECLHVFCASNHILEYFQQAEIFQAACPAIFLHVPFFTGILLLFTGIETSAVITNAIAVLLALYPFFNPLIIVTFVADYRNFVITKLRLRNVTKQMNVFVIPRNTFVS